MPDRTIATKLIRAARKLGRAVDELDFSEPITHVYNPLDYASKPHEIYIRKYARSRKRVVFLGMNPGPFGMMQTGVPFGEIPAVRDWVGIEVPIRIPKQQHPKRPIEGFQCQRSEVSGRRLWGLFAERFGTAEKFFREYFIANYCPLVFLETSGRNRTPDKLPAAEAEALFLHCDRHLKTVVQALQPEWLIGVGAFAEGRAKAALHGLDVRVGRILHPSPASPAANRDWAGTATAQLKALGIW